MMKFFDQRYAQQLRAFAKTKLLLAILIFGISCETESTKTTQERIDDEIAEKLAKWKGRRELSCRKAAMKVALTNADSMILAYAREQKLQLERPSRPIRPEEPTLKRPSDTLSLAPFLADSML